MDRVKPHWCLYKFSIKAAPKDPDRADKLSFGNLRTTHGQARTRYFSWYISGWVKAWRSSRGVDWVYTGRSRVVCCCFLTTEACDVGIDLPNLSISHCKLLVNVTTFNLHENLPSLNKLSLEGNRKPLNFILIVKCSAMSEL